MSSFSGHAAGPGAQVFWLFGLSGAGKSTLAAVLATELRRAGHGVLALDGDRLREGLSAGLGFAAADRRENLRGAAEVARLGCESGLVVVASFITPAEEQRALVRGIVGADRLALVHVDTPLAVCAARDVKGLYAGAASGAVRGLTGVGAAFEPPQDCDLRLATAGESVLATADRLMRFAQARLRGGTAAAAALG